MKNRKYVILLLCLISSSFYSYSQNLTDCEKLLKMEISLEDFNENVEDFLLNFRTLIACEFEEVDLEIFMGPLGNLPMMARPLFAIAEDSKGQTKYTFQDLKDSLDLLKDDPEYSKIRSFIEMRNAIFDRDAYILNWESDAELISKLDASEELLSEIYSIVKNNEGKKYSEIFRMYSDSLVTKNAREQAEQERISTEYKAENPGTMVIVNGLYAYGTYEDGLKKSEATNKPLLLYFNGNACVNARKMEEFIFTQPDVRKYINENFVVVNLIVDNKRRLGENQIFHSDVLNKDITTVGQKNSEFQIREFRVNAQPLFVIVGTDGKEVSRIGYVRDTTVFTEFLKRR